MTIYGREIRPEDLPVIDIGAEGAIFDELDCLDLSCLDTSNINTEQYQQQPEDGCEEGARKL